MKKFIYIGIGVAIVVALGFIIPPPDGFFGQGTDTISVDLQLKTTSDKILANTEIDWIELTDCDDNEKKINCRGEINHGKIVQYRYITDQEIPQETGEDISKRTVNAQFFKGKKDGESIGKFYSGQPFYKDQNTGKWYQTETATTSIDAFAQQTLQTFGAEYLKYPTAAVTTAELPYDDDAWVNPTNVYSDNATYSSITATSFDANDYSQVLKATGFGFTVPSINIIHGIKVEIERYNDAGETAKDTIVQLTKTGTRVGDNKVAAGNWETTPTIKTYGGETDLWGTTWTPSEINASTFGIHLVAQATAANADIYVDYIRITVYNSSPETYYSGAGDGITKYLGSTDWDTSHNVLAGDETKYTDTILNILTNSDSLIGRAFFPFNTAALPEDISVTAVTFWLKPQYINDAAGGYMNLVQTTQASNTSLVDADYDQCGAVHSPTLGATAINLSAMSVDTYATFTLSATGRGWIVTDGYTLLGMREKADLIDTKPGATSQLGFYMSEYTGTGSDPYIVVTYSAAVAVVEDPPQIIIID